MGLGNPGSKYANTRHNVGYWVLDALAGILDLRFKQPFLKPFLIAQNQFLILIKPLTFMNNSGDVFLSQPDLIPQMQSQLIVIADNMDLEPGRAKLKLKAGTAGQNGFKSVLERIGELYCPLYIGIGKPEVKGGFVDYVLGVPQAQERLVLDSCVNLVSQELSRYPEVGLEALVPRINAIKK